jgi:hypothetical protein
MPNTVSASDSFTSALPVVTMPAAASNRPSMVPLTSVLSAIMPVNDFALINVLPRK